MGWQKKPTTKVYGRSVIFDRTPALFALLLSTTVAWNYFTNTNDTSGEPLSDHFDEEYSCHLSGAGSSFKRVGFGKHVTYYTDQTKQDIAGTANTLIASFTHWADDPDNNSFSQDLDPSSENGVSNITVYFNAATPEKSTCAVTYNGNTYHNYPLEIRTYE